MRLVATIALAVACLAACATGPGAGPERGSAAAAAVVAPAFELRLASGQKREGWAEMPVRGGGTLLVAPTPLLTPKDIKNAAISSTSGDSLILNVREGNRAVLQAATADHMYKQIVFLVDGQVVYMAMLGMPLNRQVAIRIGPDALTQDEAKRCLQAVKEQGGGK
ncbi:MAG: hypothetical protein EBQ99_06345 [Planctomycetes bacterium]|nr:hypothetical protein [Planctomycetota bacterium]